VAAIPLHTEQKADGQLTTVDNLRRGRPSDRPLLLGREKDPRLLTAADVGHGQGSLELANASSGSGIQPRCRSSHDPCPRAHPACR
jgi:hypothetical protein